MKRLNRTKFLAFLLVSALTVTMTLSGCGKEKIDYGFEDGEHSGGSTEGNLVARLGIPESYEGNISVGDSGLSSIKIKDTDIQVPASDGMSVVHFEKNQMDAGYRQKVAEAIFNRADGIYSFDWGVSYKSDIELQIQIYQALLEEATNAGDTGNAGWYEQYLNQLQNQYDDAVENREGPGDWSAEDYTGSIGGTQFRLSFYPSENGLLSYFYLGIHPYESQILYRPYAGATQAYYYITSNEEAEANKCSWSKEEAEKMAQEFLTNCGITDVVVTRTCDLTWDYTDASYNTIANELDGYMVEFSRAINGTAPYSAYFYMLDNLMTGDTFFFDSTFANETYSIYIDDNGIFGVECFDMLKPTGKVEQNVDILSWEKILEVANTAIPAYYTEHPTSYQSVTFNDVRLTYYSVNDDEEDTYKYIPVWVFAQVEEYDDGLDYDYPIQLVIIDAVTGELIDLQEKLNNNGTGGVIFDDLIDDGMFFQ